MQNGSKEVSIRGNRGSCTVGGWRRVDKCAETERGRKEGKIVEDRGTEGHRGKEEVIEIKRTESWI